MEIIIRIRKLYPPGYGDIVHIDRNIATGVETENRQKLYYWDALGILRRRAQNYKNLLEGNARHLGQPVPSVRIEEV